MEEIKTKKSKQKVKGQALVRNVWRILTMVHRHNPFFLYVGIPATVASTLLGYVVMWFSALFINRITENHFQTIFDPALFWLVIAYITLPFVSLQLSTLYNHLYAQFYNSFIQHMEIERLRIQLRTDIQTQEDSSFADLRQKVNENLFRMFNYAQALFGLISTAIAVAVSVVILARYNSVLALLIVVAFIPQMIAQVSTGRRVWAIWGGRTELRRKFSTYTSYFSSVPSITEMKVLQSGEHWIALIRGVLNIFNGELRANELRRFYLQLAASACMIVAIGGVTFFLMDRVVIGVLAIGTFLFLESQIFAVRDKISGAVFSLGGLLSDNLFVTDIFTYLDTPNVLIDGQQTIAPRAPLIEFKNVSFRYPTGANDVLRHMSFTIKQGEKVAVVGVNGAGKTTLSKLLMRFYDPTAGDITIDGMSLHDAKLDSWYERIGYLSQEYARYRLPVGEAIAIGNPNIPFSHERVIDAARRAGADTFIREWARGYEAPLGTEFDGVEPSIGQWQKLALARLFYKNPDIWILDEPTSSIDAVAELAVFRELESLPNDKTVVLISHRFNTVRNADKILVVEHGELAEMGTHDELMAHNGGVYATLFAAQKDSYGE